MKKIYRGWYISKEPKKSKTIIIDTIQKLKKHIKPKLIFKKVN